MADEVVESQTDNVVESQTDEVVVTAIPDDELIDIKALPSAGTPKETLSFAVQQADVTNEAQKITIAELAINEKLSGQGFLDRTKFMTPAGFQANVGNTGDWGTLRTASATSIGLKTATDRAITPSDIDDLMTTVTTPEVDISDSNIDTSLTQGAVVVNNLKALFQGRKVEVNGSITITPNTSTRNLKIYIKDMKQPSFLQGGGSFFKKTADTGEGALGIQIESYGTVTEGLGTILITLQKSEEFISGDEYFVPLPLYYFTD